MITERDLIHPNERKMLIPAVIVSVLIYIALILSIRSIAFIFTLLVLSFISHGLMLANIRINGIKLSPTQFPDIFAKAELICEKMHMPSVPDVYILQSGGILNAFATKFFGRNMVVLYSDVFDLIDNNAEKELLFILAHELAHIKRRHISTRMLILPAMWVPFLAEAYSRACEYTCDRFGAYYTENYEAARNSLTILAVGKNVYPKVNQIEFFKQVESERGFFIWLAQKLATHPPLPRRIHEIRSFESGDCAWTRARASKRWLPVFGLVLLLVSGAGYGAKTVLEYYHIVDFSKFIPMQNSTANHSDLITAVVENNQAELDILISLGGNLDQEDTDGWTALDWAVQDDNQVAASSLINAGADVNHQDLEAVSPLMRAASSGNLDIMRLLLDKGSNINAQDSYGETALFYAVYYEQPDAVKLLLTSGADKGIKNTSDETALMSAIKYGDSDIAALLKPEGKR